MLTGRTVSQAVIGTGEADEGVKGGGSDDSNLERRDRGERKLEFRPRIKEIGGVDEEIFIKQGLAEFASCRDWRLS